MSHLMENVLEKLKTTHMYKKCLNSLHLDPFTIGMQQLMGRVEPQTMQQTEICIKMQRIPATFEIIHSML